MSATLGVLLKEVEPALTIAMFETLHDCAQESSNGWNNAGTGHAGNCELYFTPQREDGGVDISKALEANTKFDLSRQLWSPTGSGFYPLSSPSPPFGSPLSAHLRRSRSTAIDPELPFKMGPMKGRKAQESGRGPNAVLAPQRIVLFRWRGK